MKYIILLLLLFASPVMASIPQPYNLSIDDDTTGMLELTKVVNDRLMGGWYGTLFMATISILTFIYVSARTGNSGSAFAACSFIGFVLSILLRTIDLVPDFVLYGMLVLAAFSVALLRTE